MATEALQYETTREDGAATVAITGDLDMGGTLRLEQELTRLMEQERVRSLTLDLGGVTFIDSTGLAAMLNALRRLTRAGRCLMLVCPDGPVLRILRLTRLDSTFSVHAYVEDALAALAART